MGLGKIAIGLIATGISAVTIAAVTTGVVVSRNATVSIAEKEDVDQNGNENSNDDTNNSSQDPSNGSNNNINANETVDLNQLLRSINETNLVLIPKTNKQIQTKQSIQRKNLVEKSDQITYSVKDVFAFDLKNYDISLKDITLPSKVSVEVNIETKSSTNLINLNNGKITLTLIAKLSTNQTATRNLEVTTFKQPNEALRKLFKKESNDDYTLDVLSKNTSDLEEVFTIEELNTKMNQVSTEVIAALKLDKKEVESGEDDSDGALMHKAALPLVSATDEVTTLTNLFKKSLTDETTMGLDKNSLNIKGSVKLEKIEKDSSDNKTYFYLTSSDDSFLRLSAKTNGDKQENSEILVKKIRVNNLAISSISVIPVGNNEQASKTFTESLKTNWKMGQEEAENPVKSLTVSVPKSTGDNSSSVIVDIAAYTIDKKTEEDIKTPTKASLLVRFGNKTYSTLNNDQMEELKEAGFSFGVFSKDLTQTVTSFNEMKVNNSNNKLEMYLKKDSDKKASMKPTEISDAKNTQSGDFFLYRLTKNDFPKEFQLGINKPLNPPVAEEAANLQQENTNNQNWITFANYSYPNLGEMKVLIPHSISLIHVEKQPKIE